MIPIPVKFRTSKHIVLEEKVPEKTLASSCIGEEHAVLVAFLCEDPARITRQNMESCFGYGIYKPGNNHFEFYTDINDAVQAWKGVQ